MVEVIRKHNKVSKQEALVIAIEKKLRQVGIPEPEKKELTHTLMSFREV